MADSTSATDMALPAGSVCPRANAEYNQVGAPGEEHGAELVVRTELDQSLAPFDTSSRFNVTLGYVGYRIRGLLRRPAL